MLSEAKRLFREILRLLAQNDRYFLILTFLKTFCNFFLPLFPPPYFPFPSLFPFPLFISLISLCTHPLIFPLSLSTPYIFSSPCKAARLVRPRGGVFPKARRPAGLINNWLGK